MPGNTRRDFIKKTALLSTAILASPPSQVLGANDRVRVGTIGVGSRGQELLEQVLQVPSVELVAIADVYSRRREQAKNLRLPSRPSTTIVGCSK